jgi:hypothetical protein
MLMMSKTKIYVSIGILMFFVLVVDSNAYQNTVSNSDQIKPLVQVNNSDHVQVNRERRKSQNDSTIG